MTHEATTCGEETLRARKPAQTRAFPGGIANEAVLAAARTLFGAASERRDPAIRCRAPFVCIPDVALYLPDASTRLA